MAAAKSFIAVSVALLVVTGCAEPVRYGWAHPNGTAGFERDRYACMREAAAVPQVATPSGAPPSYPTSGGFAAGFQYGQAMSAYNAAVDQAQGQQALALQLFGMCMQNRGYHLKQIGTSTEVEQLPRCADTPFVPGGVVYCR
jgi:hypothetical protein